MYGSIKNTNKNVSILRTLPLVQNLTDEQTRFLIRGEKKSMYVVFAYHKGISRPPQQLRKECQHLSFMLSFPEHPFSGTRLTLVLADPK